ncbi:MAG: hypothetical protein NT007_00010 [Candidatus Kapabacteria bacterium]|nr:hypothetical protein [Candidatus Kapabacteria bacterium]
MKKVMNYKIGFLNSFGITIIFYLLLTNFVIAQNTEPTAFYFRYNEHTTAIKMSVDSIKQTGFVTGAQWGVHPRIARALYMDCSHGGAIPDTTMSNNLGDSYKMNYIWCPNGYYLYAIPNVNSRAFVYKPTLIQPTNFHPNNNDPNKNIWGFKSTTLGSSPTVIDNKLLLDTGLAYSNPILSNPWINNKFYLIPNTSDYQIDGQHFIVTVNLRRKDLNTDTSKTSDTILKIILPYYMIPESVSRIIKQDSIKFDLIQDSSLKVMHYSYNDGTTTHAINRGYCRGVNFSNPRIFAITKAMLPNLSDSANYGIGPDITISANFTCNGLPFSNKLFKSNDQDADSSHIDSLGLNINYHGNSSILLNYIRIGNPKSDKLFKGEYDSLAHAVLQNGKIQ